MKKYKLWIFYGCGVVSGLFISFGHSSLESRHGSALGGEVLIIPLIVLLIYFGYHVRQWVEEVKR